MVYLVCMANCIVVSWSWEWLASTLKWWTLGILVFLFVIEPHCTISTTGILSSRKVLTKITGNSIASFVKIIVTTTDTILPSPVLMILVEIMVYNGMYVLQWINRLMLLFLLFILNIPLSFITIQIIIYKIYHIQLHIEYTKATVQFQGSLFIFYFSNYYLLSITNTHYFLSLQ